MSTDANEPDADAAGSRVFASVREALDGLRDSADVHRVYGDPITAGGKTIVPVARIAYGIGGGFGSATDTDEGDSEGVGGGGGMLAHPIGVFEVTENGTRFVRVTNWKRLALAVGVGVVLGRLLGRR